MALSSCNLTHNAAISQSGVKRSGFGGCIVASEGSVLTISDSVLAENSAETTAGSLLINGNLTMSNSVLYGSKAVTGGAVYGGRLSNMDITNCTFSMNVGLQYGGAITSIGITALRDSTFVGNGALVGAGLVVDKGDARSLSVATVQNCTFMGNQGTFGGAVMCNVGLCLTSQVQRSLRMLQQTQVVAFLATRAQQ
jgi:hypothetical protein